MNNTHSVFQSLIRKMAEDLEMSFPVLAKTVRLALNDATNELTPERPFPTKKYDLQFAEILRHLRFDDTISLETKADWAIALAEVLVAAHARDAALAMMLKPEALLYSQGPVDHQMPELYVQAWVLRLLAVILHRAVPATPNFVTLDVGDQDPPVHITVQRQHGKTPRQLILAQDARIKELEAQVAAMEGEC